MESLKELNKVAELLSLEKKADYEQFKNMVQSMPMQQRIEKGYCWYPVELKRSGFTVGDRAFVTIRRTNHLETSHHFRAGKVVNFFTKQPRIYYPERAGTIDYINKDEMRIILNAKDLPVWLKFDMRGVELLFDAKTYKEMEKALEKVRTATKGRLVELREVLLGQKLPEFYPVNQQLTIPNLNKSQNDAIKEILAARDIAIVHGPPGTGKTTTLIYAIKELCKTESTVLVTAPSNTAVDLLTERLAALDLTVVRIGNISRVDESILNHTLEVQLSKHPESRNIKKVRLQVAELRKQAWRIRRRYNRQDVFEKRRLKEEANDLSAWANQLEERLIDQIISSAQVVTCTLVGANHPVLEGYRFRTAVIDEAAQALEPATWIPITKVSKVVLAGDPFQLPPTLKSVEARKKGLEQTLIEKGIERLESVNFLNVQYRMNEKIMQFSNTQFYDNKLRAADSVKYHRLDIPENRPVEFVDTAGCGFDEKMNEEFKSKYNPDEFQILSEHLYLLLDALPKEEPLPSIAIISPYRQQVIYIKNTILEDAQLSEAGIDVNTIDGFQGQERDIVYISLVRSNRKAEIGFLKDYRRMNVAMTRARKKLIVFGDSATIGEDSFYKAFLEYCDRIDSYRTAWEFMIS